MRLSRPGFRIPLPCGRLPAASGVNILILCALLFLWARVDWRPGDVWSYRMAQGFTVGPMNVGSGGLFLIAGPCVIESEAHALKMAEEIAKVAADKKIPYIFKASYDKANRTSIRSFRGPGIEEGLRILGKIRSEVRVPVLTDVHEAAQAARVGEVVDVLQIPAFLCRQTDLLVAAARTGKTVNVKKGQFVSPWDMRARRREGSRSWRRASISYRTRDHLWVRQSGGRHEVTGDHAEVCAGGFRRDSFGATSLCGKDRRGRRGAAEWRATGVYSATGAGRRSRRSGWRIHRGA